MSHQTLNHTHSLTYLLTYLNSASLLIVLSLEQKDMYCTLCRWSSDQHPSLLR